MSRTAQESLRLTGLFEAELLLELMLRHWDHPLADDSDFRGDLLEATSEVLRAAVCGQQVVADLPAGQTNLIAAIWCAEQTALSTDNSGDDTIRDRRQLWLDNVRRAIPSCFCARNLLP